MCSRRPRSNRVISLRESRLGLNADALRPRDPSSNRLASSCFNILNVHGDSRSRKLDDWGEPQRTQRHFSKLAWTL